MLPKRTDGGVAVFRIGQGIGELLEQRRDFGSKQAVARGTAVIGVVGTQFKSQGVPVRRTDVDMVDFGVVVIVGGHPENRHGPHAGFFRHPFRQLDGRYGLVNRIERTGEESGLLSRGDHEGIIADQGTGVFEDDFVRPVAAVLRLERTGYGPSRRGIRPGSYCIDRARPDVRVAGIVSIEVPQ